MKTLYIMVFSFSFFALILGAKDVYWIAGGKSCRRDYGEEDRCIHYSNCMANQQRGLIKGYPEFCRFSGVTPILCCIEHDKLENHSGEQYEMKTDNINTFPPLDRHANANNYQKPHQTNKEETTTPFYEPEQIWSNGWGNNYPNKRYPHQNYHHWPYEHYPDHKATMQPPRPPFFGDFGDYNEEDSTDENKKLHQLFFHAYDTITTTPTPASPKPQPPQNPGYLFPTTATTNRPSQPFTSSISNGPIPGEDTQKISSGTGGNFIQTVFSAPPSNATQTITVEIPFYKPTPANSTSLRRCIEYFRAVPLLKGRHTPVIGGRDANPKEFPHLALLGYGEANDIQWLCGGSLISEQYVLTAAHCILAKGLGPVRYIRLGELDVSSTTDDAEERDFTVEETIRHPLYTPIASYHDIALIKLNSTVETFSRYIRPACLATGTDLDNVTLVTAGWGLTEVGGSSASILQRTNLKHVDNERCKLIYGNPRNLKDGIVENIHICADGGKEVRDSCQGDSGGPLQYTNYDYSTNDFLGFVEVAGITSFGRGCGLTAGVYTRVLPYVQWIESIVWPQGDNIR